MSTACNTHVCGDLISDYKQEVLSCKIEAISHFYNFTILLLSGSLHFHFVKQDLHHLDLSPDDNIIFKTLALSFRNKFSYINWIILTEVNWVVMAYANFFLNRTKKLTQSIRCQIRRMPPYLFWFPVPQIFRILYI